MDFFESLQNISPSAPTSEVRKYVGRRVAEKINVFIERLRERRQPPLSEMLVYCSKVVLASSQPNGGTSLVRITVLTSKVVF